MTRTAAILAGVTLVLAAAAAQGATAPRLQLWASTFNHPVVGFSAAGFDGPLLTHLRQGVYRIQAKATDDMPLHLVGPGVDRRTPIRGSSHVVYTTWVVRLRPGHYRYFAEGVYAVELRVAGFRTSRSFRVP